MNKRRIRICYWNSEPRIVAAQTMRIEKLLDSLGTVEMFEVKALNDRQFNPCDLLIITAQHVPSDRFLSWLEGIRTQLKQQAQVWIPVMILADIAFSDLNDLMTDAIQTNWYFDIVHSTHLDSLPIRIANLLRIHDHLHELKRYHAELGTLGTRVEELEKLLKIPPAGP